MYSDLVTLGGLSGEISTISKVLFQKCQFSTTLMKNGQFVRLLLNQVVPIGTKTGSKWMKYEVKQFAKLIIDKKNITTCICVQLLKILNQTKTLLFEMSLNEWVTSFKNMQDQHIIYKLIMK